ncbi:MAG: hypothetical protein H6579_01925 [Chitinophagales bacterium]|nr:hypothetical protein [Bacteroidota bacterium]MCB9255869.1 hypothetical protein [Chitinophagales bacterium]
MKLKLLLLFSILALSTSAQYSPLLNGKISCARFFKTTTYIVLSDSEKFNQELREAAASEWKLTPTHFIPADSLEYFIQDPALSFVYLNRYPVRGEKREVYALALFNGGFASMKFFLNSTLAYVSADDFDFEKSSEDLSYRAASMLLSLQQIISGISNEDLKAKDEIKMTEALSNFLNEKAGLLKEKTLLVEKRYSLGKIVDYAEVEKKYPYAIQLVSKEEIEKALKSKESDKAVLISAYNLYKTNMVIDCANLELIYAELEQQDLQQSKRLDKFNLEDLNQLIIAIKKSKN